VRSTRYGKPNQVNLTQVADVVAAVLELASGKAAFGRHFGNCKLNGKEVIVSGINEESGVQRTQKATGGYQK